MITVVTDALSVRDEVQCKYDCRIIDNIVYCVTLQMRAESS